MQLRNQLAIERRILPGSTEVIFTTRHRVPRYGNTLSGFAVKNLMEHRFPERQRNCLLRVLQDCGSGVGALQVQPKALPYKEEKI